MRLVPALALGVLLAVMWRHGYRGEVSRVVLGTLVLFLGSRAVGASTGLASVLLGAATVAVYAALIIKRKAAAPPVERPQADQDGYLREAEPVDNPDQVQADQRFDSGGLAEYVRRQQDRKAS